MNKDICPYLGVHEEIVSHFDYPSTRNRCWQSGSAREISTTHQERLCISDVHSSCPLYHEPPKTEGEGAQPKARNWRRYLLWLGGILLIAVVVAFIAIILFQPELIPPEVDQGARRLLNNISVWVSSSTANESDEETESFQVTDFPYEQTPYPVPDDDPIHKVYVDSVGVIIEKNATITDSAQHQDPVSDYSDTSEMPEEDGVEDVISEIDNLNEMPETYGIRIRDGDSIELDYSYALPSEQHTVIQVDQQIITLIQDDKITYQQEGPEFIVRVEGVHAEKDSEEVISVTPDGKSVIYRAGHANEITIVLMYTSGTDRYYFTLYDVDAAPGGTIIVTADLEEETFMLFNGMYNDGDYRIAAMKYQDGTTSIFMHGNIEIGPNDTHIFLLGEFDVFNSMQLETDRLSDGSIDSTSRLDNFADLHYLPYLSK